ncbi:MAG: GrpB family protein [Holosporales bacterium]|jgi:GrpB-like predicted nucleotidyltransferase (UPF0157 family)|nr:GrpB family protein [Holosporales bacterium]
MAATTSAGITLSNDCYDRSKQVFLKEVEILQNILQSDFVAAHHIGSTSVRDLLCKPRTDIALELSSLQNVMLIETAGYKHRGELNIPFRHFFRKNNEEASVNLHALEKGNPEVEGFLMFRNYLANNREAMTEYAELKKTISAKVTIKEGQLLAEYTLAKDGFIRGILKKAGFEGLCIRYVTHYNERDYASKYRTDDAYLEMIFYKGPRIIGYSCLNENLDIVIFNIDEPQHEEYFREKVEKLAGEKAQMRKSQTLKS